MVANFLASIPAPILEQIQDMSLRVESTNCQQDIDDLLERTVLVGGKRLRPLLTHLMGNLFGLPSEQLSVYAKSIELVHAASLSHDDVVDNATTRRGVPSINTEGNKRAVLAGDYLLSNVIVELTKQGNLQLVGEMAQVISALAEGEWLQLDASESRQYSREVIEKIALCKTASVMSWCCVAPAILKNFSPNVIEYCREFGENLGIAFQQMDDTLDFSDTSNKDHSLDLKNGIVNSVVYEWLQLNPELKEKFEKGEEIKNLINQNGLDSAICTVKENALARIERSRELLDVILSEIPADESEKSRREQAKKPVLLILEYLANRKF